MSRMSELHIEIAEKLEQGFDPQFIAETLDIPLNWVYNVASSIEYDYDDSMDGDHESALTSAGWGTDESYVMDNDYFDDY